MTSSKTIVNRATVDHLKELIDHARQNNVLKLCYDGLEIILDAPMQSDDAPKNQDDMLYYSSN